MESCDECGFVYASVDVAELPGRIGRAGPRYAAALAAQLSSCRRRSGTHGRLQLARPGPRTLRWLARHTVHEIDHHLRDVTGQNGRVTEIEVRKFAAEWVRAWNAHDVEAVLAHFADDVVFTSPVAARVVPETGGVVRGKEALRAYWNRALRQVPDLRFEVEAVYAGVSTLVIAYRNQAGGLVSEVLEFDGDKVVRGHGTALVA